MGQANTAVDQLSRDGCATDTLARRTNARLRLGPSRRPWLRPIHINANKGRRLTKGGGASNGAPLSIPQSSLLQVVLKLSAPRWVTQLAQRFRLDLTDALASDVEFAADLFERPRAAVLETEPQLQHPPLAAGESFEDRLHLLL